MELKELKRLMDGDWVVDSQGLTHQIERVVENVTTHTFGYDIVGGGYFNDDNEGVHLWTIDDAKEGDVLAYVTDEEDLWIMIYWSLYKPYEGHVHYHALLANDNFSDKGTCCICINDLKPATKEQRDTLFAKMEEAGYEWDSEKKELKKIELSDVGHEYYSELLKNDKSNTIGDYAYQCAYCMSHDWALENPTWDDVQNACKLGAKWQRNIVWHDVAEEPKEEKDLLLIFTWQDGRKSYSIGLYSSHAKNVWVSEGRNFHWKKLSMYSKWAYIDELLPTGINK